MICQKCESEWPDDFEFCPRCGILIVAAQADDAIAAAVSRGAAIRGEGNIALTGDV